MYNLIEYRNNDSRHQEVCDNITETIQIII